MCSRRSLGTLDSFSPVSEDLWPYVFWEKDIHNIDYIRSTNYSAVCIDESWSERSSTATFKRTKSVLSSVNQSEMRMSYCYHQCFIRDITQRHYKMRGTAPVLVSSSLSLLYFASKNCLMSPPSLIVFLPFFCLPRHSSDPPPWP